MYTSTMFGSPSKSKSQTWARMSPLDSTSSGWCSRYSRIANSRGVRSICSPHSHTLPRRRIQSEVAGLEHGWPWLHPAAAQRPQPRDKDRVRERLGQVVVGSGVQPLDLVPHAVLCGQHQDRGPVAFAAQRPAHLIAIRTRQHDVENDGVEGVFTRHPDAIGAVVHDIDGETLGLKPFPQPGRKPLLVLDHQ